MNRLIHRTSVIFVSSSKGTRVYRDPDEVPPRLRRRMKRAIAGRETQTLWIADEKGREELERSARETLSRIPDPEPTAVAESTVVLSDPVRTVRVPSMAVPVVLTIAVILLTLVLWLLKLI